MICSFWNPVDLVQPIPKWGRKWPRNGFWHQLENGPENGKKGPKLAQNEISDHFPIFRTIFPQFPSEAKIHFSAIFVPISGRRPEMSLYEVHGIPMLVAFSDFQCPS